MALSFRNACIVMAIVLAGCGGKSLGKRDAAPDADVQTPGDARVEQIDTARVDERDSGSPEAALDATLDASVDAATDTSDATAEAARRPYRAIAVVTGRYHACALMEDHKVKCWGENASGQLGLGDKKFRGRDLADMGDALPTVDLGTGRTATALAAGRYATCAILDTGALKCWGMAQLTGVPSLGDLGDEPGEMGDALLPVDLGGGRKARRIAVGAYNACVERDDGTLRCWGTSDAPTEVTVDGTLASLTGAASVLAIFDDGSVANLSPGVVAPVARLPLARPARAVSGAGSNLAWCAVLDDASLACRDLTLIVAPPTSARVKLAALTEQGELTALLSDGTVRTWRDTGGVFPWVKAPAGDALGGSTLALGQAAQAIVGGGYDHACALLTDGSVKCWSRSPTSREAAIGAGPDNGISGTTWRGVDLGTR